jgi:hypothetical protein
MKESRSMMDGFHYRTSFGEGRATIDGGDTHAIHVTNTSGFVVRDLRLVGFGRNTSKRGAGLLLNPGHDAHLDAMRSPGSKSQGSLSRTAA